MPPERDDAICLRAWDWSETSQTVALFTRAQGLVRALAKGSKRERSPYSGGLEPLTLGEVVLYMKKNHDLATLASWALADPMQHARSSLDAFNACAFVCELLQRCFLPGDPHPSVFETAWVAMTRLGGHGAGPAGEGAAVSQELLAVVWRVVDELGHRPVLDRSASDGQPLADADVFGFSPEAGGLVPDPGAGPAGGTWRVRTGTVALLRALASEAGTDAIDGDDAKRATALLVSFLSHRLGVGFVTAGTVVSAPNGTNRAFGR